MMAQSLDTPSLVTIAIPCFNAQSTIERAIKSAQNQDWPNTEILVVDDASEDGSVALIEAFAKKDKRIRLFSQKTNQGVAVARNILVEKARGEFIAFFDTDDESYPERISLQYQRLTHYERKTGADLTLCYAGRRAIPADGTEPYELKGGGYKSPEPVGWEYIGHYIPLNNGVGKSAWGHSASCALFMRRAVFDLIGPFDSALRRSEDLDYVIRAGLKGAHFISVDKTLLDWYINNEADYKADKKIIHYQRLMYQKYKYLFSNGFQYWATWQFVKVSLCRYMAVSKGNKPLAIWYRGWFDFWLFMISSRPFLSPKTLILSPLARVRDALNKARNILRPFTRIRKARHRLENVFRNRRANKGAIAPRKAGK